MKRTRGLTIVITLMLTVACGADPGQLASDSTTDVMVPDDPRFADSWEFTLQEGPDNYTVRSNWDPSYNPNIDSSLVVTGFQIGDPATWTGAVDAENGASQAAFVDVLTDSVGVGQLGVPCSVVTTDPQIVSCTYDVDQADPLPLLVRRFTTDTGEITMVIIGTSAGVDYLSGSFTPYPVSEAAERWLSS